MIGLLPTGIGQQINKATSEAKRLKRVNPLGAIVINGQRVGIHWLALVAIGIYLLIKRK